MFQNVGMNFGGSAWGPSRGYSQQNAAYALPSMGFSQPAGYNSQSAWGGGFNGGMMSDQAGMLMLMQLFSMMLGLFMQQRQAGMQGGFNAYQGAYPPSIVDNSAYSQQGGGFWDTQTGPSISDGGRSFGNQGFWDSSTGPSIADDGRSFGRRGFRGQTQREYSPDYEPVGPINSTGFSKDWSKKLKHIPPRDRQAFMNRVQQISQKMGTDPDWLMGVMQYESSINPRAVNRSSGATGLIQFMPDTARKLGTSTSALRNMSALQQLDYVERYLEPYKGRMNTPTDTYMAVFSPAFIGKGDNHVAYRAGQGGYDGNRSLDLDKNSKITNGELGKVVRDILAQTPDNSGSSSLAARE